MDAELITSGKDAQSTCGKDGQLTQSVTESVLTYGMMTHNFQDASREGDSERLLRCHKFLLLLTFKICT